MGRVVLSAVGGDTGLAGRVSAGLAERGLDVSFLDANYNAGLGNSSTVARPSASGRKPSSIEGCSHMVLLCCPAYVRLLFHPGNSTLRRQVKAAVDAGCSLVPVVSKAWRGISPFTPSHEVAIDDKGFLMFHEHEASALFKAHPVYHYVDSGEGFQLLLSELAAACGCPAHGHNAAALSTLLGAAGLGGGAVRGRLEGMGVRSVADLRALHAAHVHAVHGPPGVGLTEAEATELRLALTGWAHTSTLPRWLRNVEPPLHNALLFVLAASAPSTEQPGLCPTSTSFSRRPSSINAAPSYLAPAPPTAGPPTGWPSLELSPSLGTRGKLGRAGAAAVAALLAELEAVQQAIGGGRSAGAAAAQKLLGALSLRGCGLDAASAGLVLGAPVRLAGLTEINLSGNVVIGADVQDARALGAAAARACSGGGGALTRLRLAHTGLSDEGGAALLSGLAECGGAAAGTVGGRWCGISHLDIGGNALGPASATALARLMRCAPRLSALGLSGTRLASEPVGAASLVAALWGHSSGPAPAPLAQLELSGCAAGGTAGDKGAGALAHAMLLIAANSNTNGKSSDRSGNSPGNSSSGPQWVSFAGSGVARGPGCAAALADAISLGLLLEVKGLSLAWAGPATQQATEGLLRALSATGSGLAHSLLALDLSGCQLGSGACAEMLSIVVLPSLPTLKSLRVEECGLGVRELAQLLAAVALPGALLDLLQAAADAALSAWTADAPEQPWPSTHPAPSTPSTPSTSTLLAPFARASVVALIERFVLGGWRAMREAARRLQAAADSGMDGDCVDGVDGVNGGGVNGGGVNSGLVGSPRSPAAHGRRSSSFTSVGIAAVTPREGGLSVTVGNSPSAGGYSPSGGGYSPSVGGYGGHNRQRPSTASLGGASVATTALGSMRVSEFRSGPAPPLTLQLAQAPGYASGQAGALSGGGKGVILKGVYAQMHIQGARAAASTNSALFSATNARFHRPTTGNVMHTKPIAHLNGGRQRPQSARPCGGVDSGNGCGVDGGVESVDPAHPALELLLCHPAVGRALVECRRAVTHAARNGGASADGCVNDVDDAGGGAASLRRALSRALGPLRASSSCRITSLSAGRNTLSLGASPAAPTAAAAGAVAAAGTAGPSSWGRWLVTR
ncbi:hypothetical protein FOA52_010305 [Chlamydomonas sp. UWO 241]|nr:hypothetical protein FOA52_010305 [Chlamydomonas sp. UWO 241]